MGEPVQQQQVDRLLNRRCSQCGQRGLHKLFYDSRWFKWKAYASKGAPLECAGVNTAWEQRVYGEIKSRATQRS